MASARSALMDEIYDQFLVCKICFEIYKRPKTLQCLHTFCMECLEHHQDAEMERSYRYLRYTRAISCPICRKKTDLPSGGVRRLPDNFLVANLGTVISRKLPDSKLALCEICKPDIPARKKQATCRCLDCSKLLCKKCVDLHRTTKVTQDHSIFDIDVEKDIECKVHSGETVRFYCEPCEMCICVVCTFQEHKGHEISSFAEGMQKHSRSLDNLVDVCKDRIDMVKDQLDIIYKCETQIKEAEESIRDMAIETISEIRDKEKDTVEKMHEAYGEDTFDFLKEKQILQDNLENLQSTCNLTDIITKDKSLELLLLKKEIQEKLQNLLQRQVRRPPDNAMKQVRFIPGNVVFGYLSVTGTNGEQVKSSDESDDDVIYKPQASSHHDISRLNLKNDPLLVDCTSQTSSDDYITVGNLIKNICDQLTQTDGINSEERGTSPIGSLNTLSPPVRSKSSSTSPTISRSPSVETRERHTMTPCTPTMRRKVQTESTGTSDEGAMQIHDSRNRGTDTRGLVHSEDTGTAMSQVMLSSTATLTDTVAKLNKASYCPLPVTKDKLCGTVRLLQTDRETMTRFVSTLEMGVEAKFVGEDKAIGTRTTITMHASCGDGDVRTRDQAAETPWNHDYVETTDDCTMHDIVMVDQGMKTEPTGCEEKNTFTSWFNMQSKETETDSAKLCDASTGTYPVGMKSRGLNTIAASITHRGTPIQTDFLPKKPRLEHCICQTSLTFNRDIIMPNMTPCDKNVGTDFLASVATADSFTSTAVSKAICTSLETLTASPQISSTHEFDQPVMEHKEFGSRSVLYFDKCVSTIPPHLRSVSASACPDSSDVATETNVERTEQATDCVLVTLSKHTSTAVLEVNTVDTNTDIKNYCDMCTETESKQVDHQETTMFHNVDVAEIGINVNPTMVDNGQNPHLSSRVSMGVNTKKQSFASVSLVTEPINVSNSETTTNHTIHTQDIDVATDAIDLTDSSTNTHVQSHDKITETKVQTVDVGLLKRPHTVTRGVCTKRTKLVSAAIETEKKMFTEIPTMTQISYGSKNIFFTDMGVETVPIDTENRSVGTPPTETMETSTSMPVMEHCDRESSPVNFNTSVDRGSSPIDFTSTEDRASSPIRAMVKDVGILVGAKTREMYTSTLRVKTRDTCCGYDRPAYCDKQNSPVRNLISTRTKFTCTPHVKFQDRCVSPIPPDSKNVCTNTKVVELADREASPLRIAVTDHAVMATVSMVTKSAGTPKVTFRDQDTGMKQIKHINKCTEMPKIHLIEKGTYTPPVHHMHKNVSTENVQTKDQSTMMAVDVAESYKDLVAPKKPVTITRGTGTQCIVTDTKETSTPINQYHDRASSPVLKETADKGVTANKAEALDNKDKFLGVGKGKASRPLADSPRSSLAIIKEDSQESGSSSDEWSSTKDSFPDLPSFSPKLGSPRLGSPRLSLYNPMMEGRPQMGLGFGNIAQREKIWKSSPTLGTSHARTSLGTTMGANMLHAHNRIPQKPICRTEAATSTKDVYISTETRATSTTDIEKEKEDQQKVPTITTEVMQGKMAECINKLKTVRQRLEQQPVYTTAVNTKLSETESPVQTSNMSPQPAFLNAKSRSVDSHLNEGQSSPFSSPALRKRSPALRKRPSIMFSSTSESPSEGSDQEQSSRRSRPSYKARKQRLEINQLLRTSSLPEQSDPSCCSSSSPETAKKVFHLPPRPEEIKKESAKLLKDRPKSPRTRPTLLKEQTKERPKSPRERERPKSARSSRTVTKERPALVRQRSHESPRTSETPKDTLKQKPDIPVKPKFTLSRPSSLIPKDKTQQPSSPQLSSRKAKGARYDDIHPLLPSSPRNIRRLSEGTEAVRARLGETPKQRRERLEQQLSFEDRKALTRQYFQDTQPLLSSPRLDRYKSAKSSNLPSLVEKPPKMPPPE